MPTAIISTTCNFTKSETPPWVFSRFANCTNGTKLFTLNSYLFTKQYLITVSHYDKPPRNIYFFKVNSVNTRKRCEICSTLTAKTSENVIGHILTTEHISHLFIVLLLLTLDKCFQGRNRFLFRIVSWCR